MHFDLNARKRAHLKEGGHGDAVRASAREQCPSVIGGIVSGEIETVLRSQSIHFVTGGSGNLRGKTVRAT